MRIATVVLGLLVLPWAAWAETHVVTIEGMKFEPAVVTVRSGDKVVWRNRDLVPHTATAARKFDSGEIGAGKSWSWIAPAPGRYEYVCTYHPGMKGAIVLE
jgi:plastocyanin